MVELPIVCRKIDSSAASSPMTTRGAAFHRTPVGITYMSESVLRALTTLTALRVPVARGTAL
jgi:hypothetical protein